MVRLLALLGGLLLAAAALAQPERIERFHSDIVIDPDGSMRVSETIAVIAGGEQIRRGITAISPPATATVWATSIAWFRPRRRAARRGPEDYHTRPGQRRPHLYRPPRPSGKPGAARVQPSLPHQPATGLLRGPRRVVLERHGNGWDFAIQQASARVRLPESTVPVAVTLSAYTGRRERRGGSTFPAMRSTATSTLKPPGRWRRARA